MPHRLSVALTILLLAPAAIVAIEPSPERGYRFLVETPLVPPDFDEGLIDDIVRQWPKAVRNKALAAAPADRRRMFFERYGLTPRPEGSKNQALPLPLQYAVVDGKWSINCFACHGGQLGGEPYPGMPNQRIALQSLHDDLLRAKVTAGRGLSRKDLGSLMIPLGGSHGTTNAVIFGVALMHYRDVDLNLEPHKLPPPMLHHDMDAPPWWHYSKRKMLYIDGFTQKGHRALMPFVLVRENGPEKIKAWEDSFRDVEAYLTTIEPPKYKGPIDPRLASAGAVVFEKTCARCHGTYGEEEDYPGVRIPIDELGTDPARLKALTVEHRTIYGKSWFGEYGRKETLTNPGGYVAPPLDGVWASAPYFHNGSVPTLWHVLNPDERPRVWRWDREKGLDPQRVGLAVTERKTLPPNVEDHWEQRAWFDTRRPGKSAAGHDYPSVLNDDEKRAVLEYLKTL